MEKSMLNFILIALCCATSLHAADSSSDVKPLFHEFAPKVGVVATIFEEPCDSAGMPAAGIKSLIAPARDLATGVARPLSSVVWTDPALLKDVYDGMFLRREPGKFYFASDLAPRSVQNDDVKKLYASYNAALAGRGQTISFQNFVRRYGPWLDAYKESYNAEIERRVAQRSRRDVDDSEKDGDLVSKLQHMQSKCTFRLKELQAELLEVDEDEEAYAAKKAQNLRDLRRIEQEKKRFQREMLHQIAALEKQRREYQENHSSEMRVVEAVEKTRKNLHRFQVAADDHALIERRNKKLESLDVTLSQPQIAPFLKGLAQFDAQIKALEAKKQHFVQAKKEVKADLAELERWYKKDVCGDRAEIESEIEAYNKKLSQVNSSLSWAIADAKYEAELKAEQKAQAEARRIAYEKRMAEIAEQKRDAAQEAIAGVWKQHRLQKKAQEELARRRKSAEDARVAEELRLAKLQKIEEQKALAAKKAAEKAQREREMWTAVDEAAQRNKEALAAAEEDRKTEEEGTTQGYDEFMAAGTRERLVYQQKLSEKKKQLWNKHKPPKRKPSQKDIKQAQAVAKKELEEWIRGYAAKYPWVLLDREQMKVRAAQAAKEAARRKAIKTGKPVTASVGPDGLMVTVKPQAVQFNAQTLFQLVGTTVGRVAAVSADKKNIDQSLEHLEESVRVFSDPHIDKFPIKLSDAWMYSTVRTMTQSKLITLQGGGDGTEAVVWTPADDESLIDLANRAGDAQKPIDAARALYVLAKRSNSAEELKAIKAQMLVALNAKQQIEDDLLKLKKKKLTYLTAQLLQRFGGPMIPAGFGKGGGAAAPTKSFA